ncbi:MAG: hypothetical protein RIC85_00480 [Gammaproteobacteria bacterium]
MAREDNRESGNHGDPGVERPDGIDPDLAELAKEHAAELEKKRYDYAIKDGHDGFSVAGLRIAGSAAGAAAHGEKSKKKRAAEEAFREALLTGLMEQLTARLEEIDTRIGALEERLEADFGADFLEDNAQMYLGDAMPERPPGMSDSQWQAMLRGELGALMLGPDGKAKEEYAHLDITQWLQWTAERDRIEAIRDRAITYLETTEDPPGIQAQTIAKLEMSAKVSGAMHADGSVSAAFKDAAVGEQDQEPAKKGLAATKDAAAALGFDIG